MPPVACGRVLTDDQSDEGSLVEIDRGRELVKVESVAFEVIGVFCLRYHVYLRELPIRVLARRRELFQEPWPVESEHDLLLEVSSSCRLENLFIGEGRAHGEELFAIFEVAVEEIRVVLKDVLDLEVNKAAVALSVSILTGLHLCVLIVADPSVAGSTLAIKEHSERLPRLDVDGVALVVIVPQVQCPAIHLSCTDCCHREQGCCRCPCHTFFSFV